MKSELFEDVDMLHRDPSMAPGSVVECTWLSSFEGLRSTILEFPFHVRRERYHRTSGYVHQHQNFFALYIVRAGRGIRFINGRTCSLARGDIFLMAANTIHAWREPVDLTLDVVYFQQSLWNEREWEILLQLPDLASYLKPDIAALEARGNIDHFGHLSPEPHARIDAIFKEMRREFNTKLLPQRLSARARLFSLLVLLAEWRASNPFNTRPARGAGMSEVLGFCESNFHRPITNQQLADLMHFSEGHFREVFTREVGITPAAYLRHLRLQHGQRLLANNRLPVADIARLCGFESATPFGRAFKNAFGSTPLEYRKTKGRFEACKSQSQS
ncbi:AraC family transcriptional regulator [bacterium]|nr:MAG: AraC family transcriptional regulator [bacterium]